MCHTRVMPIREMIGRRSSMTVRRIRSQGAFLGDPRDPPDGPTVLLPGKELAKETQAGETLSVFLYLDSEDRPIATLQQPAVELGQVAFLEVKHTTPFGAFVDWGLAKDLLVPLAEQICEMNMGSRYAIGPFIDRSGRLAGTARVAELLKPGGDYRAGQWVQGEAWREERGIGLFVILDKTHVGLVPATEPHKLWRGQSAAFRVATVLPDGKIELSLRAAAHEEMEDDARLILSTILKSGAAPVGDRSSPEQIRSMFGLSKKAFKRAAGRLIKQGAATIDSEGFLRATGKCMGR
jgi:uncharacterized protein